MESIFWNCHSLITLDISTFNTCDVTYIDRMFDGCSKLSEVYVKDERIKSGIPKGVAVRTGRWLNGVKGLCFLNYLSNYSSIIGKVNMIVNIIVSLQ